MSDVSQGIPSLALGVSQQPFTLRAPGQAELQKNMISTLEEGTYKRPPTEHVAELGAATLSTAKIFPFDKSSDEQGFAILPGDGTITIRTLDGTSASVTMTAPADYINSVSDPVNDLVLVPIGDYIFVINKTVTPAMKSTTFFDHATEVTNAPFTAIWVRQGQLSADYKLEFFTDADPPVSITSFTHTTASTAGADKTNGIASALSTGFSGSGTPALGTTMKGSVIFAQKGGDNFTVEAEDSLGNAGIVVIPQTVDDPVNLPPQAIEDYQVKVLGDRSTDWDDYYLQYDRAVGTGQWVEVPQPGRTYILDEATMPHVLRRTGTNTWEWDRPSWKECPAGDSDTNPEPSFIGNPIIDAFFVGGRLGFMTEKSVIMSAAGDLFNFWRDTVTVLSDDMPIDVEVTQRNPAPRRHAVEFDDTVFFCTDKAQYAIPKTLDVISPRTIRIPKVSDYAMCPASDPATKDDYMFFARNRGTFSTLFSYEAQIDDDGGRELSAREVTRQAPRYIKGVCTSLTAVPSENIVLVNANLSLIHI